MAVFLWHQNGMRRCLACASGLCQSHDRAWVSRCNRSKNGATVLTLWYKLLRGETGLAAFMHWLKFGEIGALQACAYRGNHQVIQINRVPCRLWTTTGLHQGAKETHPMKLHRYINWKSVHSVETVHKLLV